MTTISKEISTRFKGLLGLNFPPILGPLLVLIVLILGISIIKPRVLSADNLANLARQSSILLLLAIAETFIILMGSIDLSIEGSMALSSVVIGLLAANYFNSNDYGLLAVSSPSRQPLSGAAERHPAL